MKFKIVFLFSLLCSIGSALAAGPYWNIRRSTWSTGAVLDYDVRFKGPVPFADVTAFGAKCDNSTNDTAAFNAAVLAATSGSYNGIVLLPKGICRITTLDISSRPVTLQGQGEWETTLQGDGSNHVVLLSNGSVDIGFTMKDMAISFNSIQSTYDGVRIARAALVNFIRVRFDRAKHGIFLSGSSTIATITDCVFGSNNVIGLRIGNGCDYAKVSGCWFNENLEGGLFHEGKYCVITGNRFAGNSQYHISLNGSADFNSIVGNAFQRGTPVTSTAIYSGGNYNNFVGNVFSTHSVEMQFTGGVGYNVVAGNMFEDATPNIVDAGVGNSFFLTGPSGVLSFGAGSDTNLYRSTNDTLKTDDDLIVAGGDINITSAGDAKLSMTGSGGKDWTVFSNTSGDWVLRNITNGINPVRVYGSIGSTYGVEFATHVYINKTSAKILLKSPDASCSSCGVDNSDVFSCSSVVCP